MIYTITAIAKNGSQKVTKSVGNNPDDAIFDAIAKQRLSREDRVTRCLPIKGNGSSPVLCGPRK